MRMNTPSSNVPDTAQDAVHDAAARWFAREHGGEMTAQEREHLATWRQADPRHEQAYQAMQRVWHIAQATPNAVFESALARSTRPETPSPSRRRIVGLAVAGACSTAVAVGALAPARWWVSPEFSQRYVTQRGERREFLLPDGSTLTLNTDSDAEVHYFASERRVEFTRGEAYFSVTPNRNRPFVVDAGLATVTVTGTTFNVRRAPDLLSVAVSSGSVEVASWRGWRRDVRQLLANQGLDVARGGTLPPVTARPAVSIATWRQGKAVFDAAPLEIIVKEINRYRDQPIILRDATLQRLRVAGVFNIDDPDAFLDALPLLAPVKIVRVSNGSNEIVRK